MREFVRSIAAALGVACLTAAMATAPAGEALAQAGQAPPQQTAPAPQAAPAQLPAVKQIALVERDKKRSPNDKKEALANLNYALKSPAPPIENKGNIDLVAKYYDKLADALGDDQE